ncbi:Hint domain-containing protein [Streptomyces canus]|uniref:Hint domain-containing protein n=1 Tax=Streptomyces canus TaxID=58343 RepID=UPI00368A1B2D
MSTTKGKLHNSPVTRSDPTGLESCGPNTPSCSRDNIDSINHTGQYTPSSGNKNSTGSGSNGNSGVTTAKDGQPIVYGIRLPTKKELVARYAVLDPRRTSYSQYLARFATDSCHTRNEKNSAFCDTAGRAGLLPGTQNDPWGVKATIHCVTGRGDCGEAAAAVVITVVTMAWGSVGKSLLARQATRAVAAEAEEGALAMMLREACSFTPSTPVLLKNGKTKPIGKVKPGDKVAAADPQTGKRKGARTVTARIVHNDNDLVDVTIRGADGKSATLHATANHPFWDDTAQSWIPAGDLEPGHVLDTATNQHAQVVGVETRPGQGAMYNLTVEQLHTYYVLTGQTPVLVHNSNGCPRFVDGDIWDDSFEVGGQTIETMATVRASGDTLHLDGLMVFPRGTEGLSRAPIGPDAIRQMKRSLAEQARSEGYSTVVLSYERHIPKPDGSIFVRPGSMTLDVEKILGE